MSKMMKTSPNVNEKTRFDHKILKLSKVFIVKKNNNWESLSSNGLNKALNDLPNKIYPLEKYLYYPSSKRRKLFFDILKADDIILGKIHRINGKNGAVVNILSILNGQRRWLQDLDIMAFLCTTKVSDEGDIDSELEVGDFIKAVVVRVNEKLEDITISIDEFDLPPSEITSYDLGKCNDDEYDTFRGAGSNDMDLENVNLYLDHLRESDIFNHPQSINLLASHFKIDQENNSFFERDGNKKKLKETVEELHEKQSYDWSMNMVGVGVKHFRQREIKEAEKCFDQALTFYPKNVEGFVARGAMKANQNNLQDSVKDFRKALEIDPKHRNGRKYLIETTMSIAKGYEKEMKWKDSLQCYQDVLKIDADHKEAKDRYHHTRQLLSRKIVTDGGMSSKQEDTAKAKRKDRIEQLRKLLQEEKVDATSSSSSSTSSSSSASSASSSQDDSTREEWIEAPLSYNMSFNTSSNVQKRRRGSKNSLETHHCKKKQKHNDSTKNLSKSKRQDGYDDDKQSRHVDRINVRDESRADAVFDEDSKEILRKISKFTSAERETVRKLLLKRQKSPRHNEGLKHEHKSYKKR